MPRRREFGRKPGNNYLSGYHYFHAMKPKQDLIQQQMALGQQIFNYLYMKEPVIEVDAVIGFGHFDLKIPTFCAELYLAQLAPLIIFTGGVGAGSADFTEPEAMVFRKYLHQHYPLIAPGAIITEYSSTNTAENILFTRQLLEKQYPAKQLGAGIRSVMLVASPFRQRRVYQTMALHFPEIQLVNCPPATTLPKEIELFGSKQQQLLAQLPGEVQRLIDYPQKGRIKSIPVPEHIQ